MTQILLAEDDRISRVMLQAVLQKWGYRVVSVPDGNQALERLLDPEGPSIAILDWMMPGMTGVQVCKAIRATAGMRQVYLLLLTAKSKGCDTAEALAAGADDHISKPYNLEELQARLQLGIRRILASSSDGSASSVGDKTRGIGDEFCLKGCLSRFLPLNRLALGVVLEHPDFLNDSAIKAGACDLDTSVQMTLLNARNVLRGRLDPVWQGHAMGVGVSSETVGQILLNLLIFLRTVTDGAGQAKVRLSNRMDGRMAVLDLETDVPDLPGVAVDRMLVARDGSSQGQNAGFGPAFARIAAESVNGSLDMHSRPQGGLKIEVRLPLMV